MAFADRNKEERFLAQHRDDTAEHLRWACLLGAAIMIGFMWQDTLMSTSGYKAINIRLFGALPFSALAWYLSRNLGVRRFIYYISAFFWLSYACFTAAIFIIYEPGPYGLTSSTGLGSFLLILFGVFTFSNLRFWASLLVGLLILLVYTVSVVLWAKVVFVDFIMGDFLTAVALVIGAAAKTLFTDRARRRLFETSELLSESYTTVEQQVRERTTELTDKITEHKLAEEALRESEEKYRMLVENINEIIYTLDIGGRFTYVSPVIEKISSYKTGDLIGKNFIEFIHPNDLPGLIESFNQTVQGELKPFEYRILDGDKFRHVRTSSQLIFKNGVFAGLTGVMTDITERKKSEEELQNTVESLRKSIGTTIQVMVSAVEARDPYTSGHQVRSANLARTIATEMGLSPDKIEGIRMAGSIHDIGKLSIPAEILSKPTKLSELEFSLIKEHAQQGYEMLKNVESPWPLAQIVYQHHERMDGSGYPRNLKGEEIIMEARILAVADVVEAMASHRPYRPALGIDAALEEIEKNRGIFYDKAVVDACLRLFREKCFQLEGT
jgi:PAS domain S-box-containing protein